jgi:hypothetical protein
MSISSSAMCGPSNAAAVTTITYSCGVPSAAVIVIVIVVVPDGAMSHVGATGSVAPGSVAPRPVAPGSVAPRPVAPGSVAPGPVAPTHAPADDAYVIVALTSFDVAVTTADVVPAGTSAV